MYTLFIRLIHSHTHSLSFDVTRKKNGEYFVFVFFFFYCRHSLCFAHKFHNFCTISLKNVRFESQKFASNFFSRNCEWWFFLLLVVVFMERIFKYVDRKWFVFFCFVLWFRITVLSSFFVSSLLFLFVFFSSFFFLLGRNGGKKDNNNNNNREMCVSADDCFSFDTSYHFCSPSSSSFSYFIIFLFILLFSTSLKFTFFISHTHLPLVPHTFSGRIWRQCQLRKKKKKYANYDTYLSRTHTIVHTTTSRIRTIRNSKMNAFNGVWRD